MKKATLWVGVFTLIWFSCVPVPAENEKGDATEPLTVVRLEIGPKWIKQPDKEEEPIPQVPIGQEFWLEVSSAEAVAGLKLVLSGFRTVSFHHPRETGDETLSRPFWRWNEGDVLTVSDETGVLPDHEIVVEFTKEDIQDGSVGLVRKRMKLSRVEDRPPPLPNKPSLIFFQMTLKIGEETVFTYDPPWVEKPPTG